MSVVIVLLFVAGLSVFAYPAVTDFIGRQTQEHVVSKFNQPGFKTIYKHQRVPIGDGLTKLEINNSRVKVNVLVVQGTTVAALRAGAGHYTSTPYPCEAYGNVGIAGHRTTYGRPFNRINFMKAGDTVKLISPVSSCVYEVVPTVAGRSSNPFIVQPTDGTVVQQAGFPVGEQFLTLTSCNPPGSAAQRIVLRLKEISCKGSTCHQTQKGTT